MKLSECKIGFAITGSFCTFDKVIPQIDFLMKEGAEITPIFSTNAYNFDTRFANAKIRRMYKEYANLTADIRAEHENEINESKILFENNQRIADEIQARHDAILAGRNTGGDDINTDNTSVDSDEFRIDLGIDTDSYQEIDNEFGAF